MPFGVITLDTGAQGDSSNDNVMGKTVHLVTGAAGMSVKECYVITAMSPGGQPDMEERHEKGVKGLGCI